MEALLTNRWDTLRPHKAQSLCYRAKERFNINHSGRRSGKTEIGKRRVVKKALVGGKFDDWRGFCGAPTRQQAKKIYWSDLKALVPKKFYARNPDESNLIIYLINGSQIHVVGFDRPERIEGTPWDHGLLDEYGNMKAKTWPEHVRPSLSDRKGSCDFIGVPEGRNHYFDLKEKAETDRTGSWKVWHWPSWEVLDEEEIIAAQRDLDEIVYNQEYGGDFVSFTGRAYYPFNPKVHVGKYKQFYAPQRPLVLCFDFNVSPGIAIAIQELGADCFDLLPGDTVTTILHEVYIPKQSNTVRVCRKIIEEFGKHSGLVLCYGDSTGGAKGTAKLRGSDWDIIKQELYPYFEDRLFFNVPVSNPRERQRVNAVNSRLLSYSGKVRLLIDGDCVKTVKDFDGVRVIEGTAGEIDKKGDPLLSHITDSCGYYVHKEFPVGRYYSKEDIQDMVAHRNKTVIDKELQKKRA